MKDCKYRLKLLYFFSLGLWSFFTPLLVSYLALEDVLAGTLWPSTVVIIIYSIPDILTKVLSPYVINRISFRTAFVLLTLFLVGSYTLLVVIDDVRIRLVGVGVLGVAYGFGRITGVRLLSYYGHADVLANAFHNGFGIAALAASLTYTGLTTWTCLAPRTVICIFIPFCFLPFAFFLLIDKEPLKDHLKKPTCTDRQNVEYTSLNDDNQSVPQDNTEASGETSDQVFKLRLVYKAFPFAGYAYVSNFCAHTVMTSVLTTLTFESSPFQPRDHYQYYRLANNIGLTFGGNLILLFSCCTIKGMKFFRVLRRPIICFLVLSAVFHLLFFIFASWYRFLSNVNVVLVMCFTQGSMHGMATVLLSEDSANEFSSAKDKGTSLGLMEIGLSVGRFLAALVGISTEKFLREHCTDTLMLGRFCLARPATHAEWSTKLGCTATH